MATLTGIFEDIDMKTITINITYDNPSDIKIEIGDEILGGQVTAMSNSDLFMVLERIEDFLASTYSDES